MLTIAGGIILSLVLIPVILFSVAYFKEILGLLLLLVVAIFLIYIAFNSFVDYPVATLTSIAAIVIYLIINKRKKDKEAELKRISKAKEEEWKLQQKGDFKKKERLISDLKLEENLIKLAEQAGYLLLDATDDNLGNRKKLIDFGLLQVELNFFAAKAGFELVLKRGSATSLGTLLSGRRFQRSYSGVSVDSPLIKLSVDEIFSLHRELENYIEDKLIEDVRKSIASERLGKNFFEDIKRIRSINEKMTYVYIFQHLISEEGISVNRPVECVDRIVGRVEEDFSSLEMHIYDNQYSMIASVTMRKWNELRGKGVIKFVAESDSNLP